MAKAVPAKGKKPEAKPVKEKEQVKTSQSAGSERDVTTRNAALDRTLAQIEKQFGKGAIMQMDESLHHKIDGIPTGSLSLDIALGGYGIPRGRICEFFGPESSGKTTLALHVIANAQKLGGVCAFVDAEHALDTTWARKLGVDISSLLVSQPDTGEQALDIVEMLVKSNAVDVIVVDSVAALVPAAEMEGEMGASHMGLQARLMSQAMRKLTGVISKTRTNLIFINQIRMKIGVMFGNPETTTGGNALKFYSSVRLDIRRVNTIKNGDEAVGNHVKARIVKNKIAPPFREAEFDIMFNGGISYFGDLIDTATACEVVEKSGAWLNYGPVRLGQGRDNAKVFLEQNKDVADEIKKQILIKKGLIEEPKAE